MKKHLSSLLLFVLFATSTAANANSLFNLDSIHPYIGADAQVRFMDFEKNHGANIFKKHSPQGNIFIGLKFNDYVGVEAGCEVSVKTKRNVRLQPGQFATGGTPVPPTPGLFRDYSSTTQITVPHISLMGYLPISNSSNFQLIGSIGIARPKIKLTSTLTADNKGPQNIRRTFAATKTVLRTNVGVQYMFTEHTGMRAMVVFENTAKFNNVLRKEANAPDDIITKAKNSTNFGLGAFVSF